MNGSSPRMRGKPPGRRPAYPGPGLIPAHAGKTDAFAPVNCEFRAHPRACGENCRLMMLALRGSGSSPRMRGKRARSRDEHPHLRLIPAHAGKTPRVHRDRYGPRAHPRACGENNVRAREFSVVEGSSPRMRGKPDRVHVHSGGCGLIPAHAGKTSRYGL